MLQTLQGGRAIAAIAVAAYHLSIVFGHDSFLGEAVFWPVTDHGYLGVDFFFVLSGFIILFAHHRDIGHPERWRTYALKRTIRIYPIYWLLTGGIALYTALAAASTPLPHSIGDWLSTILLLRFTDVDTPIGPAWTLFHEILFYAIFSALIINLRFGMLIFAVWTTLLLIQFTYPAGRGAWETMVAAYNLNFLIGMAAFHLYAKLDSRQSWLLLILGVALLLLALATDKTGHWIAPLRIFYGLAFGLILCGAARIETLKAGVKLPLLALVGDASYSIYLLHAHLEPWLLRRCDRLRLMETTPPEMLYIGVLTATVIAGCAVHLLIEKPILTILRRWLLPGHGFERGSRT
jgi:peptidoglycan/LPS O-acetylase OafA/YrhL